MLQGDTTSYWILAVFVGPMVLLAVMFWAYFKNKKSKIDPEVTERATRELYKEEQRIHERDGKSGL